MKTTIKILLLSLAAAFPCVVLADTSNANMHAVLNAQNVLVLYVIAAFGFMIAADYTRSSRMLFGSTKRRGTNMAEVSSLPRHRVNAYSIRRQTCPRTRTCVSV